MCLYLLSGEKPQEFDGKSLSEVHSEEKEHVKSFLNVFFVDFNRLIFIFSLSLIALTGSQDYAQGYVFPKMNSLTFKYHDDKY